MKAGWLPDKIVKWFFVLIVFLFAAMAVAPFLVDAETRKENSEAAAKSSEKLRLK